MRTMRETVADHPFFARFPDQHLETVAGCASNARFNSGELILHEGDPADVFYLITQGRAAVEVFVPGRGPRIVRTLGPGDALGWSWLYPPHRWHYDAHALELVRAIAFDGRCLRDKAALDHDLGYELMLRFAAVVIDQLEATRLQLVDMYAHAGSR